MPSCARSEIVDHLEVGVYHCWSRCVRRAFLCGDDPLTGKNFDYRRDWVKFRGPLCEQIARRGNREDPVTGRFFEGRFGCRSLEDEAALLVCGVYVDLNQIRCGETITPEESSHTSAHDQILAHSHRMSWVSDF